MERTPITQKRYRPDPFPSRVLMVSQHFAPFVGGVENFCLQLGQHVQRYYDIKVDILTGQWSTNHAHKQIVAGLPVHRSFILWGLSSLRGLESVAHFLLGIQMFYYVFTRAGRYSAIHLHDLSKPCLMAALAARIKRVPVMITTASTGTKGGLGRLQRSLLAPLYLKVLKFCRPLIVATSDLSEYEFKSAGFHPQRIARIPRGVEIPDSLPKRDIDISRPDDQDSAREGDDTGSVTMRQSSRSRKLLYVGRLSPDKGVDVLIKALEQIKLHQDKKDLSIFELSIVGRGVAEEQLRRLTENCGLNKWVKFCGEQTELNFFHSKAHLFILPSRRQGVSSSLLEAMASGIPAIATQVGTNGEIVLEGKAGYLVEPGDPKVLADAILRFYKEGVTWTPQKISQWIKSSFDIDRVGEAYVRIYSMLLAAALKEKRRRERKSK